MSTSPPPPKTPCKSFFLHSIDKFITVSTNDSFVKNSKHDQGVTTFAIGIFTMNPDSPLYELGPCYMYIIKSTILIFTNMSTCISAPPLVHVVCILQISQLIFM